MTRCDPVGDTFQGFGNAVSRGFDQPSGAVQALQQLQKEGTKTSAMMKEAAGPSGGFGSLNAIVKNMTNNFTSMNNEFSTLNVGSV